MSACTFCKGEGDAIGIDGATGRNVLRCRDCGAMWSERKVVAVSQDGGTAAGIALVALGNVVERSVCLAMDIAEAQGQPRSAGVAILAGMAAGCAENLGVPRDVALAAMGRAADAIVVYHRGGGVKGRATS